MGFTLHAPAKINLHLKVLDQREDGYHNIVSLMQMVALYDTLTFNEEGAHIRLTVKNGSVPADSSNLVLRAAHMLQKKMVSLRHKHQGAEIILDKKIPVSAGLGGGSSDAAATLMGLNRLWSLGLSRKQLAEWGGFIGSDVPFFFYGPTAWVSGKGEQVQKSVVPISGFVVLVFAGVPVSTASVYHQIAQEIDLTHTGEGNGMGRGMTHLLRSALTRPENDLEKVTLKMQPELQTAKNRLEKLGGKGTLMSGSGPTIFARFDTQKEADSAASSMRGQGYKDVWVARLLGRAPNGFGNTKPTFSDSI
jgi:4-diphosphocytidyl-2-C-methyl-D-erythritol kinase